MNMHFDHINMTVASLEASASWYQRVFGFEKVEGGIRNKIPWMILKKDEAFLCLYEKSDLKAPFTDPAKEHQINHFGIRLSDRANWESIVKREKLKIEYGGLVEYPLSSSWYVMDPSGYEIEVSHWPARSGV